MNVSPMLAVGVGNPGAAYARTRHNAGVWFLRALAKAHGASFSPKKSLHGELATVGGCRLLISGTYMNESGRAAAAAVAYYKIAPKAVLVVHDEADLPPGAAKLKFGGGDAGHNGLADIRRHLGGDYWRLRLGVGRGGPDLADYLLSSPAEEERKLINTAIHRAAVQLHDIAAVRWQEAMQTLHASPAEKTPPAKIEVWQRQRRPQRFGGHSPSLGRGFLAATAGSQKR